MLAAGPIEWSIRTLAYAVAATSAQSAQRQLAQHTGCHVHKTESLWLPRRTASVLQTKPLGHDAAAR